MKIIMKRIFLAAIAAVLMSAITCEAQNRWNVYAGGSLAHVCEEPFSNGSDNSYGWGGGAFFGGGYEINFNSHWSLTPQIEFTYIDNGARLSSKGEYGFMRNAMWMRYWAINIPVLATFRFPVSDTVKLRFGVGPYLQEALSGTRYAGYTTEKEDMHGTFADRFNVGIMGEAAVETGNHFSYMFRASYPFLKEGWIYKTLILSVGVRYSF